MFNWSGNKGSFKGQIPFYGKTGIEFYTERKVRFPLETWEGADGRLLLLCGLREMLLDTRLLSTCLSSARRKGHGNCIELKARGFSSAACRYA